jgi:hypothetical protein
MGTLAYPTPTDSLGGNYVRIMNLEPWRGLPSVNRMTFNAPSVAAVGCHFFTSGGLGSFWRITLCALILPCLDSRI